jgi:hypothetical protein
MRKLDFTHTLDDTQPKNAPEPPEELLQEKESMPNDGSGALAGHAPAKDTLALDRVQAYLQQPGNYEVRIAPYVPSGLYETLEATPEKAQTTQHISTIRDKEDASQMLGFRFKDSHAAYEFFRRHAYQDPAKPGPLLILAPLCALCGECVTVITHDKLPSVSIFGSSGFMFHDACIARCDAHALQNQKLYGKDRHSIFTLTLYEALPTFLKTQRASEGNIASISKRLKELLDADAASKAPALAAEVMAVVEEAAEVLGKAGLGTEAESLTETYSGGQEGSVPAGEEDDQNKDGQGEPQLDEEDESIHEGYQEEEAEPEHTTDTIFVLIDPRLANLAEAIEATAESTFGTDTSWKNDPPSNINIRAGFACVARFLPPLNREGADRASVPALNTFPRGILGLKEQVFAPFGHPLAICPLKSAQAYDSISKSQGTPAAGCLVLWASQKAQLTSIAATASNIFRVARNDWLVRFVIPHRSIINPSAQSEENDTQVSLEDFIIPGWRDNAPPVLVLGAPKSPAISMDTFLFAPPQMSQNSRCYNEWTRQTDLKPEERAITVRDDDYSPPNRDHREYNRGGHSSSGSARKRQNMN